MVTASLPIAVELGNDPDIRVIVTGGQVRNGELSLTGGMAEDAFRALNCDLAFIGVAGICATPGLTEYNQDDARVKRAAIAAARRSVVLADSSKLGRVAFATVAPLSAIDVVVTDAPGGPRGGRRARGGGGRGHRGEGARSGRAAMTYDFLSLARKAADAAAAVLLAERPRVIAEGPTARQVLEDRPGHPADKKSQQTIGKIIRGERKRTTGSWPRRRA